jgi:inhibitor of KinA
MNRRWVVAKGDSIVTLRIKPSGDRMLLVEFAEEISREVNSQVHHLAKRLEEVAIPGVIEWIPAYRSLGILYDPLQTSFQSLSSALTKLELKEIYTPAGRTEIVEIPVCYGVDLGPDLEFVARHNGLSCDEVVALHCHPEYWVCLIGFSPGFPYLGGMSSRITTPRLEEPRKQVPAGSVAIGGQQTGIYPFESPGGWRIIGRTPLKLFDVTRKNPCLLEPGDRLAFLAISRKEFEMQKSENG